MRPHCQFTVKRPEKSVVLTVVAAASKEISFGAVCYGSERYANQINAKKSNRPMPDGCNKKHSGKPNPAYLMVMATSSMNQPACGPMSCPPSLEKLNSSLIIWPSD